MDYLKALESISIIIASFAAIFGVSSWRKAERWKKKYELAEDVLSKFYESQQIIRKIRSPFGFSDEGKSRNKSENETKEESFIYDKAHVVYERFTKDKEVIEKLQSLRFRFISLFGKEDEWLFDELTKIINEIFFAAREIAGIQLGEYGAMDRVEKGKKMRELQEIIYWKTKVEDDPIEQRVLILIEDVEKVCKKIIGG